MNLDAVLLDDVLLGLDDEWSAGTYGDTVVHDPCGCEIEMDGTRCPDCGTPNPLFGLI